jgi:hypothetical protein
MTNANAKYADTPRARYACGRKSALFLSACLIASTISLFQENSFCSTFLFAPTSTRKAATSDVNLAISTKDLVLSMGEVRKQTWIADSRLEASSAKKRAGTTNRVVFSQNTTASSGRKKPKPAVDCRGAPRREPVWEWRSNSQRFATSSPKKHILMAQYSSFGNYAHMIELTTPINKAYARKWGHDFLVVQGSTFELELDKGCEPPPSRSIYNKLDILKEAFKKDKKYDLVLILDADAMMYDLDFDVTTLMDDNDMMAGQLLSKEDPEPRTWNINNGITLWNLHHPQTGRIAKEWYKRTAKGLKALKEHDDQYYLQDVLREGDIRKQVKGLPIEFKNERGTVAKHFMRTKPYSVDKWDFTQKRKEKIKAVVKEICEKHPMDCKDLDHTVYSK